MKPIFKTLLLAGAVAFVISPSTRAASRDALWKAVDDAVSKGLPRTAITNLDLIIPGALKDKAYRRSGQSRRT